jgi:hypothetical protein
VAEVYEFHVTGMVGPVVRAALPELSADAQNRVSVLTGTAASPEDVDDLLRRISDAGLKTTHILITRENRWQHSAMPAEDAEAGDSPVPAPTTQAAPCQS